MPLLERAPSGRGALSVDSADFAGWRLAVPEPLEGDCAVPEPVDAAPPSAPVEVEPLASRRGARQVFRRWEGRRLLYNLVLAIAVLPILSKREIPFPALIAGAVAANVAYLIGPTVESYLNWLGVKHRAVATLLFAAESLLAAAVAASLLLS